MPPIIPGPGADVIPPRDEDALTWFQNLAARYTALALVLPVGITAAAFQTLVTAYATALTAASNPTTRTAVTVADKDVARAAVTPYARAVVRFFVEAYRLALPVAVGEDSLGVTTCPDLELWGIRCPDLVPSPIPAPATAPILGVVRSIPGVHTLRASDTETPDSRKKPYGSVALELYGVAASTPIADPDLGVYIGQYSRQPMAVAVPVPSVGLKVTYFARWVTARGLTGPWSAALTVVGT